MSSGTDLHDDVVDVDDVDDVTSSSALDVVEITKCVVAMNGNLSKLSQ